MTQQFRQTFQAVPGALTKGSFEPSRCHLEQRALTPGPAGPAQEQC